jgi:hypothetical protein
MAQMITYGLGGYDPSKPNNNIVEINEIPDTDTDEVIDHNQSAPDEEIA